MNIEDRSLTILSPHADDELIGCYRLIRDNKVKEVYYIDIQDQKRLYEVEKFCKSFSLDFRVLSIAELALKLNADDTYLVPSVSDHHPLHRKINGLTIGYKRGIYTIDMNTDYTKELSANEKAEKRKLLNHYYPSQKTLWNNDYKYFLFEGVVFEY